MRRTLEVLALISTTVVLIATSRVPTRCASETVVLHARTTCGPETNLNVISDPSCAVTVSRGGGLPSSGNITDFGDGSGVLGGFELIGPRADGGVVYDCSAVPGDGGLVLSCFPQTECADGGEDGGACESSCSGSLTTP